MKPNQGKQARAKPLFEDERHTYISGLNLEKKSSRPPDEAELFFLTSLFIELIDQVVSVAPARTRTPLASTPAGGRHFPRRVLARQRQAGLVVVQFDQC